MEEAEEALDVGAGGDTGGASANDGRVTPEVVMTGIVADPVKSPTSKKKKPTKR